MTAIQQHWWTRMDAMCARRAHEDGLRGGVLVVGSDAYEAARAHPKRCDRAAEVVTGPWGDFDLVIAVGFSPWHVLVMDDRDLVPDPWVEV